MTNLELALADRNSGSHRSESIFRENKWKINANISGTANALNESTRSSAELVQQREMMRKPFQNWDEFNLRMIARFRMKIEEHPGKRLFSMRQTGSIEEYVNEFEELSTIVPNMDEANLTHMFYTGLKPEMKEVIKMQRPRGLTEHFEGVISMEDSAFCKSMAEAATITQNKRASSFTPLKSSSNYNTNRSWQTPTSQSTSSKSGFKSNEQQSGSRPQGQEKQPWKQQTNNRPAGSLHLSPAEYAEKRRLETEWFDADEDDSGVVTELMELSLFSFLGIDSPTTTKLWGKIGSVEVVVMLDSGATHNFIDPVMQKKLQLKPVRDKRQEILLGTGITVTGSGVCKDAEFNLQGVDYMADFIVLELGNVDIILGVQFLRTLGKCEVDWEEHVMSFWYKGQRVTDYTW
ncbi:unnamed protein product [Microthlaspi erraticum]|uniref:Retrotransposon gag domain-containing protein n=1 Tax=Microthlaspi erraticum TaxID=1685480 RepID=A0A6D2I0U6_9BRAS|nr:unnamed protein product [Microthlaspi erraticum]